MRDQNEQNWGNYWQGRTGNNVGAALVGVGIEHHEKLGAFWQDSFAGLDKHIPILDMACGAGSVLRYAHLNGFSNLSGVDISDAAIKAMQSEFPKAKGIVAPVDKTGLDPGRYGLVVSQYGFEYAGSEGQKLAAAKEMTRLLRPGGQFIALCHIKDGGIEQEVMRHLADIKLLVKTNFIPAAKAVFMAADQAEKTPTPGTIQIYQDAVKDLSNPRGRLTAWIGSGQGGSEIHKLGQHLYSGTVDLFNRRKAYVLGDILGWLDGMQSEIDAYRGRMLSMKQAALSEKDVYKILEVFSQSGFEIEVPRKFYLQNTEKPAAWSLRTR